MPAADDAIAVGLRAEVGDGVPVGVVNGGPCNRAQPLWLLTVEGTDAVRARHARNTHAHTRSRERPSSFAAHTASLAARRHVCVPRVRVRSSGAVATSYPLTASRLPKAAACGSRKRMSPPTPPGRSSPPAVACARRCCCAAVPY
eukprot:484504-Prymnesium_polylepis.2